MRRFLRQQQISPFLAARVATAVAQKFESQQVMTLEDVPSLLQVPKRLRENLSLELYLPLPGRPYTDPRTPAPPEKHWKDL